MSLACPAVAFVVSGGGVTTCSSASERCVYDFVSCRLLTQKVITTQLGRWAISVSGCMRGMQRGVEQVVLDGCSQQLVYNGLHHPSSTCAHR